MLQVNVRCKTGICCLTFKSKKEYIYIYIYIIILFHKNINISKFYLGKQLTITPVKVPERSSSNDAAKEISFEKPKETDSSKLVREWQFKAVLEFEGVSRELFDNRK